MSRRTARRVSHVFLFLFAGLLIYLGFHGWVFSRSVPAQYIGYLLVAFGIAGLLGFNIWKGGPFDLRLDEAPLPEPPLSSQLALTNIEQRGMDTVGDIHVLPSWVKEGRTVTVKMPKGAPIKIVLPVGAQDGTRLRLVGVVDGVGTLLVRLCISK